MKKYSDAQNLKAVSWKERFRILYLTKSTYSFYVTFLLINLFIFLIHFINLTTFALNIKEFTIAYGAKYDPTTLLIDKFSCSTNATYYFCGAEIWLFLLLILIIEVYAIIKTINLRKRINKFTLFLYVFSMQIFAVIALFIIAYIPTITVANLSRKANAEIMKSIAILNNPNELSKVGVETSVARITNIIKSSSLENFSIAESNPQKGAVLSYLKIPKKNKDSLYKTIIIPYQLSYEDDIKKAKLSFGILLFPDSTLVINKVDKRSIEQLVPVMVDRMVNFEFKKLSKSPSILFLEGEKYNVFQKKQEEEVKKQQKEYIAYLEGFINESDGIINSNQDIINSYPSDKAKHQKAYDDYLSSYSNWYASCKRDFGDNPECETGKNDIDQNLNILKQNIQVLETDRSIAEQNVKLQFVYKSGAIGDLATAKKNYEDFLKFPVTANFQDGVFNPPDKIYIRYYEKENKPLSLYLNTILHEYLHFYSYDPDFASLPTYSLDIFLDEGFTDYLKLAIASKYLEPESLWLNYPNEIEIIEELVKHLPKEKLIQAYLDKNQVAFQRLFIEKYGPLDYENFILKGKNLSYAPLKDEELKKKYLGEIKDILTK